MNYLSRAEVVVESKAFLDVERQRLVLDHTEQRPVACVSEAAGVEVASIKESGWTSD
jgi:hypothetical protein